MTGRADPDRIHLARRAAIRNILTATGAMDHDRAERWCDAWEAEAALRDLKRDSDYWDADKLWIDANARPGSDRHRERQLIPA